MQLDWVAEELDRIPIAEVRRRLALGQVEFGRWIGCSRAAVQRAEDAEHAPDPIAVAQGEPLPSWSLRVGCRRAVLMWVLLAVEDDEHWPSRQVEEGRRFHLTEAFRRLRVLRITAESIDPELPPEAWAIALRLAVQADTWVPLRPPMPVK